MRISGRREQGVPCGNGCVHFETSPFDHEGQSGCCTQPHEGHPSPEDIYNIVSSQRKEEKMKKMNKEGDEYLKTTQAKCATDHLRPPPRWRHPTSHFHPRSHGYPSHYSCHPSHSVWCVSGELEQPGDEERRHGFEPIVQG